jgi:hypothetical protein
MVILQAAKIVVYCFKAIAFLKKQPEWLILGVQSCT